MIYCIGEALIDMIPKESGKSLRYVSEFSKQAGGAPANVAATVAKLGGQAAFISKVGNDGFGKFIVDVLNDCGVDTSYVFYSKDKYTGIIYISLNEKGERDFCGLRNDSADLYLNQDEINPQWFNRDDILHFCSVSLIDAPVRYAHIKAIESIIDKGGRVSFDINLRLMLWKNKDDLINTIWNFMKYPDYLKVSDEEIKVIFDSNNYDMAIKKFFHIGIRLKFIILSKGSQGCDIYFRNGHKYNINAYPANVIDTTGAGDCFIGTILYKLSNKSDPNENDMINIIEFASAAAAISVSKIGAISSLPTENEVVNFIINH